MAQPPAKPTQGAAPAKTAAPPAKPAAAPAKAASPPAAAKPAAAPASAAKPAAPPPAPAAPLKAPVVAAEVMHPDAIRLGLAPEHAEKLGKQAAAFYAEGDYAAAAEAAKLATFCNKTIVSNWTLLGASKAHLGQTQDARAAFDQALVIDPNDIPAWVSLGELCIGEKDFSNAAKALQKAVELDKSGTHPAARRARMLLVSRKQWQHGIPK